MRFIEQYLLQLNTEKRRWRRAVAALTALSLIVALVTTWNLRMTGSTIANSADCGIEEHSHTEQCVSGAALICGKQEHIHTIGCYSDPDADAELLMDWQRFFEDYPYTLQLEKDLVDIAKAQVGYTESKKNFQVDKAGVRHGYTRYGAWYGAPYNEWSALFVSFCLHFAGADEAYPVSSGAASMAQLWNEQGRLAPVGAYAPENGDLVFFNNNTVGIVIEVYNATFCVVRGDVEDAVKTDILLRTDPSIIGWGVVGENDTQTPPQTQMHNKPVVQIFAGEAEATEPMEAPVRRFALRATRTAVELIPYLEINGGSYFFTLLDHNNMELPKDAQGNYIAQANEGYKLTLTFNSPKGFLPGVYQYQIPNGLMIDGGNGEFVLKDGTLVGSWEVTDTGLITLEFNDEMNSRTDIVISATMGIHFSEQNDTIDFDGFVTVKVEPPAQQTYPTELSKWGTSNADTGKLNWNVLIKGHADSQIPGSILTDQVSLPDWGKPHSYTQSDMDAGINISVTAADGSWHTWTVTTDDPHLIWDENGWSYKIPQTARCIYCGEITLGSDGWEYMVSYTSTPTKLNTPGSFAYENKVTIDGQTAWGWNEFTHGSVDAVLEKEGSFLSDAEGGGFLWEFQVTIPGRPEGQRAEYSWFIMDEMKLFDSGGTTISRIHNDVNLATVMATYNGQTISIPRIQDATAQDMFAWDVAWTSEGVASTRTINLLCRCQCTPSTCHWGGCENYWFKNDDGNYTTNGFCQCWTETQNMTFIFVYKTTDMSLVENYGALGYQVNNLAQLYHIADGNVSVQVDHDDATVTVPNLFEKQLTHDFDGYTAHYRITVNEAKAVLTNGAPLNIHDEMTDTLAYISGSLVITAENANGHRSILQQGVDYTVTYDGTGHQTDASGKKVHVLNIVILKPQPVTYILDYDTTLIMPEQITGGVKYSNAANITLWGKDLADNADEKVYADINIAAKNYAVEIFKTCAMTDKPLPGATFGLYNAQGGLITTGVTDVSGKLRFQTNIIEGIVLQEHALYYLQEVQPPLAYRLDGTKYWFCFCNDAGDTCIECDNLMIDVAAVRIPFDEIGLINIGNYPADVELPATGGIGTPIYILCGLTLVCSPLVYGFSLRRRYERRSKK